MTRQWRSEKNRLKRSGGLGLAALLFERVDEIGARGLERGAERENERGHEAEQERDAEHACIRLHVEREGLAVQAGDGRERPDEQVVAPDRDEQAERAAGAGEHEALDEQLANDAPAVGAEREAERDFLSAAGAAREEHVGEIEAGDEEHAAGHAEEADGDRHGAVAAARLAADVGARGRFGVQVARARRAVRLEGGEALGQRRQTRAGARRG